MLFDSSQDFLDLFTITGPNPPHHQTQYLCTQLGPGPNSWQCVVTICCFPFVLLYCISADSYKARRPKKVKPPSKSQVQALQKAAVVA